MRVKRLRNTILNREIRKLWGIRHVVVVGALGTLSKKLNTWLDKLGITIYAGLLQKTASLGSGKVKEEN